MRIKWISACLLVFLGTLFATHDARAQSDEVGTTARIRKAFEDREAQFEKVRLEWDQRVDWRKQAVYPDLPAAGLKPLPADRRVCQGQGQLQFDDTRYRYELNSDSLSSPAQNAPVTKDRHIESYDRIQARTFHSQYPPTGFIRAIPRNGPWPILVVRPMASVFRPSTVVGSFWNVATTRPAPEVVDGTTCVLLVAPIGIGRNRSSTPPFQGECIRRR